MENAAEALKIAFAVLLFVIALTLSISSFSQANSAVHAIITLRDRESQYTYVEPSKELSRTVGIETVVSSAYRSYEQSIEIHFLEKDGKTPISLYYDAYPNGDIKMNGSEKVEMTYIDLKTGFANDSAATEFLDVLFGGVAEQTNEIKEKYKDRLINEYRNYGLYGKFKDCKFVEKTGEYYQGTGSTKTKKRVITYILKD